MQYLFYLHQMDFEEYSIREETFNIMQNSKLPLTAVGTTSVRVIETVLAKKTVPLSGKTNLFITPGYQFKTVDAMVTNFHLSESTLLMLVSAFASKEAIFRAYQQAIENRYRFFSYGDAMFIS